MRHLRHLLLWCCWLLPATTTTATDAEAAQDLTKTTTTTVDPDAWFAAADTNHDELLNRDEFRAHLRQQPLGNTTPSWFWFSKPTTTTTTTTKTKTPKHQHFTQSFSSAFLLILATELGDKTFFIAAVLSMKHSRTAVFAGALAALIIMTLLSTALGWMLPSLLSRQVTNYVSTALFLYFGFKLLREGVHLPPGVTSEELEEVEEELLLQSNKKADDNDNNSTAVVSSMDNNPDNAADVELGGQTQSKRRVRKKKKKKTAASTQWYQIALQALTLTFVAEWGDRSQIATIALAASHEPVGVTLGGTLGHSVCTGLAVVGGRMLAARISEKTVALSGGVLFLLFGLHSLFFE